MNPLEIFDSPLAIRLATAFLHFLWQGALLGIGAWLVAGVLFRKSANARYLVHASCLLLMVLCVPATFLYLGPTLSPSADLALGTETTPTAPAMNASAPDMLPPEPTMVESVGFTLSEPQTAAWNWRNALPYFMLAYTLGALVLLLRVLIGFRGGKRLRDLSQPVENLALLATLKVQAERLRLGFVPTVLYCQQTAVPTVVGVLRPTLLLPLSFASGLTSEQVELVLCHELAHIRRLDPLMNLIQRIVEAILFFHPAIWFVSHRMRIEREHCCDDLVLGLGGDRQTYIATLVEIASHGLPAVSPEAVGATRGPSQLRRRILRMLGERSHEGMRLKRAWVAVCLCLLPLVVCVPSIVSGSEVDGSEENEGLIWSSGETKVELVALREYTSDNSGEWWKPDGTELEKEISVPDAFEEIVLDVEGKIMECLFEYEDGGKSRPYSSIEVMDEDFGKRARLNNEYKQVDGKGVGLFTFSVPETIESVSLSMTIRSDDWESIYDFPLPPEKAVTVARIEGAETHLNRPYEESGSTFLNLITYWRSSPRGIAADRVVAISKDGATHGGAMRSNVGSNMKN
ncbi:MAG: M56 family metallopeptidase, partial [Candidatus Omnitrophica bacterium]|nr:M56 family metallopeptidase [Candidatus Omnitrophota bacterium]